MSQEGALPNTTVKNLDRLEVVELWVRSSHNLRVSEDGIIELSYVVGCRIKMGTGHCGTTEFPRDKIDFLDC